MGVPLSEGRFLTADDVHGDVRVCVIDEDVARRYWPQGGAIGRPARQWRTAEHYRRIFHHRRRRGIGEAG